MIDKKIVGRTLTLIQGTRYLFTDQLDGFIGYVKHYINFEYNEEDLKESVQEGVRIYFELMNKERT